MIPTTRQIANLFVGDSDPVLRVRKLIEKVGCTDAPVLLLGESGTGKEVVARSIYNVRPQGPFVTIDCSCLAPSLMESELFGHVKGAFTGAASEKIGLIEQANGGTAFFDEIGELPLELQAKLLRVLQDKEIRPVGALTRRKTNFRVIAATNRELSKEVREGRFREDLYYRLNVVKLRLPPLRERKEDVPLLVEHFLELYGAGHLVSPELMDAMVAYDWPGNVRQLENCIRGMIVLNSRRELGIEDMPSALQFHQQQQEITGFLLSDDDAECEAEAPPVRRLHHHPVSRLSDMERKAIIDALAFTRGDRAKAAKLLGIGRTTLYRRLRSLGLERAEA